ncbi:M13-type metalloendopeptidase [Paenibacillus filicis]|uniref:M13-type metalloendopeptidase n=1 Tax=Paenibacillus filicis TaxID=669464 RepID=A0ABU9DCU6_9BACL
MKKMSAVILSLSLLATVFPSVHAADKALSVWLNGEEIQFSQSEPVLENGVTLVPMRPILEKLDVQLNWDEASRTVSGAKDGLSLSLQIGSTDAIANGQAVKLEVAPKLIQNVTYLPLRFVAETIGYQVAWNQSLRKVNLISKQARLQDDFYEAVNAKWLESTQLPADKVIAGGFSDLGDTVQKQLSKDMAKMAADGRDRTDDEIGNMIKFYKLAADRETLSKQGYEAIKPDIEKIKSINSLADFAKNQKDLYDRGLSLPFTFAILSDMKDANKEILYMNSPKPPLDKSFFTSENPQGPVLLGVYKNMLAELLTMVGETKEDADRIAGEAVDFEKEYAQFIMSAEDQTKVETFYNPKTMEELKGYSKNIDLEQFVVDATGKKPKTVSLMKLDYFENLDKFINEKNWEKIKSWTYATFVLKSASMLSDEFVEKSTQLGRALGGQDKMPPTEETVYHIVNAAFQDVAGDYYGRTYLGEEAKQDVKHMVENMIGIYKKKLLNNDWLSESTKQGAIKKLDNINIQIGYPDKLSDMYASFKVDENKSLYENHTVIQAILNKNDLAKMDQPMDRNEWTISANTANATYRPLANTVSLPAAALQAPFYDKNQSASWNYGGIGAIIGHELSHAFDTNGSKYDEVGNRVDWWTAEDYKKFEEKAKAFVDQYNKVEYMGQTINGQRTVPENIADIGGIKVALEAAKQLPDANLKDFYQSWATVFRQKVRPEIAQLLLIIDPNPPSKVRVNTVIANTDDFYSTFDVKEGDAMYMAPEDRVSIW